MEYRDLIIPALMGIGLAAATGLRIFIPLLVAGLALRFHLIPFIEASWLSSLPALVTFAVASVIEVISYKVPVLDHFLDAIGAPFAVGAGGILASQVITQASSPTYFTILSLIAGAGAAGLVHGTKSSLRLVSTKATLGTGNPIFSTIESFSALLASVTAIFIPILAGILLLGFLILVFAFVRRRRRRKEIARVQTLESRPTPSTLNPLP